MDFGQAISNDFCVAEKSLGYAGTGFRDELSKDFHSGRMAATASLSGVAGWGTEVALAHSPVLLGNLLGVAGVIGIGSTLWSAGKLAWQARNAHTAAQQDKLAEQIGAGWGKTIATLAESAPALIAGGLVGAGSVSRSAALKDFSFGVTRHADYAARALMPESLWFKMPGSLELGEDILLPDGSINVIRAGERLYKPFNGTESGRSIDMVRGRASMSLPGTPTTNYLGVRDRTGLVYVHSHPGPADLPSLYDIVGTSDIGIVAGENQTTIYKGFADRFRAARKLHGSDEKALAEVPMQRQAVVLDHANQRAFYHQGRWRQYQNNLVDGSISSEPKWINRPPIEIDYQAARRAASHLNPSADLSYFGSLSPRAASNLPPK